MVPVPGLTDKQVRIGLLENQTRIRAERILDMNTAHHMSNDTKRNLMIAARVPASVLARYDYELLKADAHSRMMGKGFDQWL